MRRFIRDLLKYCLGDAAAVPEKETDLWEESRAYVSMYRVELLNVAEILTLHYATQPVSVVLNAKKSWAEFVADGIIIARVVVKAKSKVGPDSAEVLSTLSESEKAVFALYLPNLRVSFSDPPKA